MAMFCEHGNKSSSCIKDRKSFDHLTDPQIIKENSSARSYLTLHQGTVLRKVCVHGIFKYYDRNYLCVCQFVTNMYND
jgi:hypothetical protein